jgi:hypothetical protein
MLLTNYNGEVSTTIFDKTIPRTTLNNDGNSPAINFDTLGETIFRGNASIANGLFEFSLVPRDIRIPLADGRISFYAKRPDFRKRNWLLTQVSKLAELIKMQRRTIFPNS